MAANPLELTAVNPEEDIGRGGTCVGGIGVVDCFRGGSTVLIDELSAIEACMVGDPVGGPD